MNSTPLAITAAVGLGLLLQPGLAGAAQGDKTAEAPKAIYRGVSTAVKFDISPPLSSMKPLPFKEEEHTALEDRPSGLEGPPGQQDKDPVVQTQVGARRIPSPTVTFDAFNGTGPTPPDPNGDVGPSNIVVMANVRYAVYSKTGTLQFGPININTLWSGFGGDCETDNSGDPVVLHDQFFDRWILTQFTASGPTFFNCVAISTTPSPTGSYFRYAFSTGTNFPDYPKYGVWPDAYYISTREFAGASFAGIGAYALNRFQMVVGNPAAQVISFLLPPGGTPFNTGDGLLPTDLDGNGGGMPPVGTPNFFLGTMDLGGPYGAPQDAINMWKFHVDFVTPANSTFIGPTVIPVAAFDSIFPCSPGSRDCIPQPTTAQKVDILSYRQRPIFRGAYRNFGTHQSIVTNQSVEATPGMAGTRWYEIRDPNGTPIIFQQGTFAPADGIHRWMGSIAQDNQGNMALGYSTSNATTVFPSSTYTGRLVGDPLGTMPQGEANFVTGTGSQTGSPRWGDYTSMNSDPTDECTFWYFNEYYPVNSPTIWRLRVGAFKFPSCIPVPVELQKFDIE